MQFFSLNNVLLNMKYKAFLNKINKLKKTKNFDLLAKDNCLSIKNSILSFCVAFLYTIFVGVWVLALPAVIVFVCLYNPNQTTTFSALVVGILAFCGNIVTVYLTKKTSKKERYDNSIFIIMEYLIKLYQGKYSSAIKREDLCYIFMNVPKNILELLREIQGNVKLVTSQDQNKNLYLQILKKEIIFLIVYIREYYNLSEVDLNCDVNHERIIDSLISSANKTNKAS